MAGADPGIPSDSGQIPASGDADPDTSAAFPARTRRRFGLVALVGLVGFLAVYGLWTRLSADSSLRSSPASPAALLQAATAEGTSLAAVGRISGLGEPCTAWLLDVGAADDTPAYAVTTGRCVGASDLTAIPTGLDVSGASVDFRTFAPETGTAEPDLATAPVEAVEWASVRGTDLAVLRLGTTYGDLARQGIRPISPVAAPEQGTEILIAGVPVEGISPDQQFLRGSRCQAGATTDVLEDARLWHDLQASGCRGILEGSQGSAVFNAAGQAVGMVNTSTIGSGGGHDCALGRPCEVSDDGVSVAGDRSYMVPVDVLASCFPGGVFALGGLCPLEQPGGIVPASPSEPVARPGATVLISLTGERPQDDTIRVKQGPLGEIDCRDPLAWQSAQTVAVPGASRRVAAAQGWSHSVTLPEQEGFTLVCVGSPQQPTEIVIEADGTPPDPGSIVLVETPVRGAVLVEPVSNPPDLTGFRWVSGPAGSTECGSAEGYVEYRGVPATIQAADLPRAVCVIGIDAAGNESAPAARVIE